MRPVRTRFRYGSAHRLTSPQTSNSPARSAKSTPSQLALLRPLVSTRFQVLFHSPPGVLFTFPSRYLFTIGRQGVLSLTGWSPQIPTGFPVPGRTQVPAKEVHVVFAYGAVTRCGVTFQSLRLPRNFVTSRPAGRRIMTSPTTPGRQRLPSWHYAGLGSSPFARHYSGNRGFFPFLRLLRCFSSPACLHVPYVFRHGYARITTREFPHSEIPGSKVGQHLPRAYRSRPRPSSALGAKASTVCPCSLDSERTR